MGRLCEQSEYTVWPPWAPGSPFSRARDAKAAGLLLLPVVWAMVSYQHSPLPLLRTSPLESLQAVFPPDSE